MKITLSEFDELHLLIGGMFDGKITDQDFDRLREILRGSLEARHFYVRYVDLHATLWRAAGEETSERHLPEVGNTEASPAQTEISGPARIRSTVPFRPSSSVLGFLHSACRSVPGGEFAVGSLVILVVAAAFWGLASYTRFTIALPKADVEPTTANVRPATPHTAEKARPAIGRILATQPWMIDGQPLDSKREVAAEHPVIIDCKLRLPTGVAELNLTNGVRLTVEGPAEIEPKRDGRVWLHSGRVVALVPAGARGFIVQTNEATIIDLGTEFGVSITANGATKVSVFQGIVEVSAWNAQRAATGQQSALAPTRLVAGESGTLLPGKSDVDIEEFEFDYDNEFLRSTGSRRVALNGPRPPRPALVSKGKPIRGSSVYTSAGKGFFLPEKAVDGRLDDLGFEADATYWIAEDATPAELVLDLETIQPIHEIRLQNTHNHRNHDRGTKGYRLSVSPDGSAYQTVSEGELPSAWNQELIPRQRILLPKKTLARFIKFEALSWYGAGAGLSELQVWGTPQQ